MYPGSRIVLLGDCISRRTTTKRKQPKKEAYRSLWVELEVLIRIGVQPLGFNQNVGLQGARSSEDSNAPYREKLQTWKNYKTPNMRYNPKPSALLLGTLGTLLNSSSLKGMTGLMGLPGASQVPSLESLSARLSLQTESSCQLHGRCLAPAE